MSWGPLHGDLWLHPAGLRLCGQVAFELRIALWCPHSAQEHRVARCEQPLRERMQHRRTDTHLVSEDLAPRLSVEDVDALDGFVEPHAEDTLATVLLEESGDPLLMHLSMPSRGIVAPTPNGQRTFVEGDHEALANMHRKVGDRTGFPPAGFGELHAPHIPQAQCAVGAAAGEEATLGQEVERGDRARVGLQLTEWSLLEQ